MSSILKVDEIQDTSGNNIINENANTITIGKSGDTVNLASGATAGFGKILQVVTATDSTNRSTTSTSYVTGSSTLSVNITPSSTSSKVLIHLSCMLYIPSSFGRLTIFRDSTDLAPVGGFATTDGDAHYYATSGIHFLDSPSTTSQITYQMRFKSGAGTQTDIANAAALGSITAFEVGA